jgi:hypothetical protein
MKKWHGCSEAICNNLIISISSMDEKLVVRLKHIIDYVIEKLFGRTKSLNKKAIYSAIERYTITMLYFFVRN